MKHLKKVFESEDIEDDDDVIENLLSILRKFIKNAGYDPYVSYDDGAIVVQFILNEVETMPSLMKAMNLINKLHTDILIQYQCDFDLAETTTDKPLVTASFYYDEYAQTKKRRSKSENDNKEDDYYKDKFPF